LLCLFVSDEGKKFYEFDTRSWVGKIAAFEQLQLLLSEDGSHPAGTVATLLLWLLLAGGVACRRCCQLYFLATDQGDQTIRKKIAKFFQK
jgi:hypothetical protein